MKTGATRALTNSQNLYTNKNLDIFYTSPAAIPKNVFDKGGNFSCIATQPLSLQLPHRKVNNSRNKVKEKVSSDLSLDISDCTLTTEISKSQIHGDGI